MTQRYYRFAGLEITVSMPEEMMYEKEYRLAPFGVETVRDPHVFSFEYVDALTPPAGPCLWQQGDYCVYQEGDSQVRYIGLTARSWEGARIRAEHRGKEHRVQMLRSEHSERAAQKSVLNSMALEHLAVEAGGVVFHCSCIARKGKAILFTAPSETGKSTQADLWNRLRGTPIINGDRAVIRVSEGAVMAEGIPFSGSSTYCENRSLPLEAIVYLAQAPKTTIRRFRGYEAFSRIWEGVSVNTWNKADMERASETVMQVAGKVPVFYLPCTPDESAVEALEQELRKLVEI